MKNLIGISGKIGSGKDTVGKIIQGLITAEQNNIVTLVDWEWIQNYHLNCNWETKKFAGKLKEIVSLLTGIPVKDLEKQEVKDRVLGEEWWYYDGYQFNANKRISYPNEGSKIHNDFLIKPTVRQLLQEIGTDAMRDVIHSNVWVNALFADYKPKVGLQSFDPLDHKYDLSKGIYNALEKDMFPNWIITDMRFPNELKAIQDRDGISIRVNRKKHPYEESFDIVFNKHEHPSETALDNSKFDYTINNDNSIEELIEQVKEILIKEKII